MLNGSKKIYKKLLAKIGMPYLNKILTEGFPEQLKTPLTFLLTQAVDSETERVRNQVESIREKIDEKPDELVEIYPSPEPNSRQEKTIFIALSRIAQVASINPYWGTFLYLISHSRKAETILELGSCAGISGCYLSASSHCQQFMTVEGAVSLANIVKNNIEQICHKFVLFNTLFDSALDRILPNLTQTIDVAYIDGNHEKTATLHYLQRLKPYLSQNAILLFDDIHWTKDMEQAWKLITQCQGISYSIDLGRIGLAVWNRQIGYHKTYSLALYTDYWKHGKAK